MDIAGIDVLAHVAKNLNLEPPPLVGALVERVGSARKPDRDSTSGIKATKEILTLDPATMTYRPKQPARLPSLEAARSIEDTGARIKTLFLGRDKVGEFLRDTLAPTLAYTARVAADIAYSIDDVDSRDAVGLRLGAGPFEILDAIGPHETLAVSFRRPHAVSRRWRASGWSRLLILKARRIVRRWSVATPARAS